jgi:hypothetical protein
MRAPLGESTIKRRTVSIGTRAFRYMINKSHRAPIGEIIFGARAQEMP